MMLVEDVAAEEWSRFRELRKTGEMDDLYHRYLARTSLISNKGPKF